jgi:hypothetical protein
MHDDAQARAAATYNAAADAYDDPANSFWDRFGRRTVDRLGLPRSARVMRTLSRLVRPGGSIAITTWGPRFFAPVDAVFWRPVQMRRPDLQQLYRPWERVAEPDLLRALFSETGAAKLDVVAEPGAHPLRSPEDWCPMVLRTGYRGTIEQMSDEDQALVKRECLEFIGSSAVSSVEANVVYAIATKDS